MKSIDMKRFVLSSIFKFKIKVSSFIGIWDDDKIERFLEKILKAPIGFKHCGALSISIQNNIIGSAFFNKENDQILFYFDLSDSEVKLIKEK